MSEIYLDSYSTLIPRASMKKKLSVILTNNFASTELKKKLEKDFKNHFQISYTFVVKGDIAKAAPMVHEEGSEIWRSGRSILRHLEKFKQGLSKDPGKDPLPEKLIFLIDRSEESLELESYLKENFFGQKHYMITYCPAEFFNYKLIVTPSLLLERTQQLISGSEMWKYLEILKNRFSLPIDAPQEFELVG